MAALWTNKTAVYDAHMTLDEVSAIAAANGTPAQLAVLQRLKEDLSTLHGGLTAMVKVLPLACAAEPPSWQPQRCQQGAQQRSRAG